MNELLSAAIPTSVAYLSAQTYCIQNKIPFFTGGTKDIKHKILINLRNLTIGILTSNLIINKTNPFVLSMNPLEETISMIGYSLLVELYFYWLHRTLHENKWLYKHVHKEHHLETVPSPIDAYILTVSESVMIVTALTFPLIFGYDITKRGAVIVQTLHLIAGILLHGAIPETDHHMIHHSDFNTNYAGSYPLWDNIFGTRIYESRQSKTIKISTIDTKPKARLQIKTKRKSLRKKSPVKSIWNLKGKILSAKTF